MKRTTRITKFKSLSTINGFTLTEMMIAVAIVGITSSIAIPNYTRKYQTVCQSEAINRLILLANSSSAYKDIYGTAPTTWEQLSNISAVMTNNGPADKSDGLLTQAISTPSCKYAIRRSSARSSEEFIFNAVPTPNTGDKAAFNVVSCFDLSNGATDLKRGNKDVDGAAQNTDLNCW